MRTNSAALGASVSKPAWAKVNLSLHVTGQRADGYHLLDSLAVRAAVGDTLSVVPSPRLELFVEGPYADGVPLDDRNLVIRAARLLDPDATRGARLVLTKVLPTAAGIGGGSADAATALKLLSNHWDVPIPEDVASLGADVPVCLHDAPQRMRGVGEILTPLPPLPPCWLVLVNPNKSVSTPEVFKRLVSRHNEPMPDSIPAFDSAQGFAAWLSTQRNDLEQAALGVVPEIAACLAALDDALLARMSGSGATCFGLYASEQAANHAAGRIDHAHPGWWVSAAEVLR
ncbi:4-diphosphocytidyl-2-C-methyl-D-erythritol kinase [Sulfitobacter marinus]|uniref:4-diphosphocytidyl-2-C-methyl-D-erythritol kinase n=1 Tax=Sulfitobacter marinus TaxID=394264 RepID=A0A1I6RIM6_9RHOB|nr:4-(cytidine 5'-diphospho)-2-C-methyl-D-erythritol kinase [Sulfitobacter marinus]SFS64338.1 4-diphosphocytidyl-2-C-methyl-D-erythritol kinase [Sulfitobacter marinus]